MKPIVPTEAQKLMILKDFTEFLNKERMLDNKISYSRNLSNLMDVNITKPIVYISPEAYLKMYLLIQQNTGEIGWHGTVFRDGHKFTIADVFIYPQTVSSVTVNTDQTEYQNWLMAQPDEVFNYMRFQAHSHVHMAVSPSGVDLNLYDSILQTLRKNDYYIFAIMNKKNDINIWIYDFSQNVIFDKDDITLIIPTQTGEDLEDWLKGAKSLVKSTGFTSGYSTTPTVNTPANARARKLLKEEEEYYNSYSNYNKDYYGKSAYELMQEAKKKTEKKIKKEQKEANKK